MANDLPQSARKVVADAVIASLLAEILTNTRLEFDRSRGRGFLLSPICAGRCFRCNDETPVRPVPDVASGFLAATRFLAEAAPSNPCSALCVECWYSWICFRDRCWYHLDYRAVATANAAFDDIDIMLLWLAFEVDRQRLDKKTGHRFPVFLQKILRELKKRGTIQKEWIPVDPFDRVYWRTIKEIRQFLQHDPALLEVVVVNRGYGKETSKLRRALGI